MSEEARLWKTDCLVVVRALCIRGEIYIQISSYKNKKLNLWQLSRGAAEIFEEYFSPTILCLE